MEDPGIKRYLRRIKVGRQAEAGTATDSNRVRNRLFREGTRTRAAVAVFTVLALLLCGVVSLSGNLRSGQYNTVGFGSAPMAQATSAPAAPDAFTDTAKRSAAGGAAANGQNYQVQGSTAESQPGSAPATTQNAQTQPQPWDRKIIRTATLQLTVTDVAASIDLVRGLASQHGGYVFQLDSHQDGDYTVSTIVIQVPSQEFDKVMPDLRKLGGQVKKIGAENVSSSDVTEEYTDLQSQLRNLQATETRMLALQQKADKLEDILSLDRELRQVQGSIEQIQGRLNFLGNRAELSSITITLNPDRVVVEPTPTPVPETGWNPADIAAKAWNNSLQLLSGVATVVITLVVFMWWAIPLLLIGLVVALRMRGRGTAHSGGPSSGATPTPPSSQSPTTTGEAFSA